MFSGKCTSAARLDGKTAIVTGSNTGIGKVTAKEFYRIGAKVIVACRDVKKAEQAVTEIVADVKGDNLGQLVVEELDLASFASIKRCAKNILQKEKNIHLLVNNAGVMACPKGKTQDGFETQFGVNHLGHFLFTSLLLPRIRNSTPARIVNVSSMAHTRGVINFEDINYDANYSSLVSYSQSKLANVLFSKELSKRLEGTGVHVYSLHPGIVQTELGRTIDQVYFPGMRFLARLFLYPCFEAVKDFNNKADNLMKFKSLKTNSKKSILKSLNLEDLKLQYLDRIPGLYVNSDNSSLYLTMMLDNKTVVGYKEIKLENNLDQNTVPDDCCWGIAQVPPLTSNHSQSAIIVDDFKHLLVLAGHQSSHHIICLPHGVRKLPQELLPSLEYFNKLILWFGNDQIAWNSARTFAKKLIENRCYFIRPTDDQPSPYLAYNLGLNIDKILKTADKMVHPSIIQFSTIRNEVYAELQNHDKTLGMKWTKFPALNKIIGGHRRGELTLLTGPTGSGKTTFISEYSLDLAEQGLPTLWGSFEIRNQRLAKIMLQQFAKEPVHLNLDLFDNLADQFEKLPLYFLTFHGPQPLNMVMDAVMNAVYVHDIGHVIIDNVQFMMGIGAKYDMGSERFWQQDSIIAEFRRFATYSNCHVTLVMHPRKEKDVEQLSINSIFGTAKATQEADNILIIQNKVMESLQIKKYLQVSKNRYNGNLGVMSLEFNKQSLSFSQQKNL